MPETNEIRRGHYWEFTSSEDLSSAKSYVYCYRGIVADAAFMDTDPGKTRNKASSLCRVLLIFFLRLELYSKLCTIEVDLSHLWNTSSVQTVETGSGVYYKVDYELVMLFGGTEIEAQLCWTENVRPKISTNLLYLIDVGTDHIILFDLHI